MSSVEQAGWPGNLAAGVREPPCINPWLITVAVMLATFMEVLDTSIANVALPHIAGSLSASTDESTWVLTSYLISNAIVLPATSWFSAIFGRKRFLLACIGLFTLASIASGAATSLGFIIVSRVVQGAGGGALQPISQAVMLESFPPRRRGAAMAAWGVGVVVAPIIGPTLGGWLTDNYSWRWCFYINVPVGLTAVLLIQRFVFDPPYVRQNRATSIDYAGFGLMAVGLGTLQVILDKGQEVDWFGAVWLRWAVAICSLSLLAFVIWELRTRHPIVDLRVLKNRNLAAGTFLIALIGVILYSVNVLLPLFLQDLMGYPALQSGLTVSPRGVGTIASMVLAGRLIGRVPIRVLIATGLIILAIGNYQLGQIDLQVAERSVILPMVINGFGLGLVFVPLTTAATSTLRPEEMGRATGLYNLMRNIGGSVGISLVTTMLARGAQTHQALMVGHLTPYHPPYRHFLVDAVAQGLTARQAYDLMYETLIQQATLWAYVDTFRWLALAALLCVPTVLLFKRPPGGLQELPPVVS